jgi:hypothetical protein
MLVFDTSGTQLCFVIGVPYMDRCSDLLGSGRDVHLVVATEQLLRWIIHLQ